MRPGRRQRSQLDADDGRCVWLSLVGAKGAIALSQVSAMPNPQVKAVAACATRTVRSAADSGSCNARAG